MRGSLNFEKWSTVLVNDLSTQNIPKLSSVSHFFILKFLIKIEGFSWSESTHELQNFSTVVVFQSDKLIDINSS